MFETVTDGQLMALIGGLGGVILGLAARLGRFCTLGAIEDLIYGSNDARMRMWLLAIGTAIVGSFGLISAGLLDPRDSFYYAISWSPLASVVGGLCFGYGMALAGNCGFGALARLGGGDLRAFVIVLVLGVSAYVVLAGPLAPVRILLFPQGDVTGDTMQGIAHSLAAITGLPAVAIGLFLGLAITVYALGSPNLRAQPTMIVWGIAAGLAIFSGWAGTAFVVAHSFEPLAVASHSFSAPVGETVLYAMTGSGRGLSFAVGSVAGVWIGAFIGSLIKGHFRWEACEDPRELRRQIFGAVLMGGGAVVALGCTIGQGMSAFSLLAWSAPVTFAAIVAGAALGLKQLISGFQHV